MTHSLHLSSLPTYPIGDLGLQRREEHSRLISKSLLLISRSLLLISSSVLLISRSLLLISGSLLLHTEEGALETNNPTHTAIGQGRSSWEFVGEGRVTLVG